MDGTSSLDQPTGARKYSMAAPSAGERAAKADRMDQAASDRMLSRTMRDSSQPAAVRIAAAKEQQNRRETPGYVNGRGIRDAEQNRNQDRKTAENFTKEGLRLEGKENPADVVAGQADAANKGVGVATADGGTNSKIGTSAADAMKKPASGALGNGSGSSAENARESLAEGSTGGSWTNVGPSATDPAATPSAPPAGPANDMPAADDWKQQRATALDDKKKQFAIEKFGKDITDWTVNDPEDQGKKSAQIFEYGKSLGISPEQIEAQADKARNGQVAEAKEKSKYQATDAQKAEGAADDFGKAYGAYLNGAGKTASKEEKDAKYAELKGTAVKNGFVVTKEAKDKAAWTSYEAKVKAAKDAGIDPNTITSETNFGEEAKALVPGAKKEVSDLVNAVDSASSKFMDPMGDIESQVDQMRESRGALDERASTEIGDRLQSEVVPDNVKAARESLSGLDGGGWNLAKGQEMLAQQANANKPSPTKEVAPQDPRLSQNLLEKASPFEKATLESLKNESYSNAWWKTSGASDGNTYSASEIENLKKSGHGELASEVETRQGAVQGEMRVAARKDMIKYSLARGVDLTPLASKDPEFLKQWDAAKQSHEIATGIASRKEESSRFVDSNKRPL